MTKIKESGFAVPFKAITSTDTRGFEVSRDGLVITGGFEQRRTAPGITTLSQNLRVETSDTSIDFNSMMTIETGARPSLRRAIAFDFGQEYPHSTDERVARLPRGRYSVTLSEGKLGDMRGNVVVFEELEEPRMQIIERREDVYIPTEFPVTIGQGGNSYRLYEIRNRPGRAEQVIYDSADVVKAEVGGVVQEFKGFNPHPLHSQAIEAALKAATQYAAYARSILLEKLPEFGLGDIGEVSGPYQKPTPNLLDVFMVKTPHP